MNDIDIEEIEKKMVYTPKKRASNINSEEISNGKIRKESCYRSNVFNKRLRFLAGDKKYYNHCESPKSNISLRSTPITKSRRSISGDVIQNYYGIKSEKNQTDFDITDKIKDLDKIKTEKLKILDYIHKNVPFKNKVISIDHLDQENRDPDEDFIIRYPKLFDANLYSKFSTKITLSTTKLSVIYLCQHRCDSQFYIVKSGYNPEYGVNALSISSREILNEIKILSLIGRHVHILDYFDAWLENDKTHLQLEYVGGGSLYDFIVGNTEIKPLNDPAKVSKIHQISCASALVLLAQISSTLIYMHDILSIFHGDIKPSNILVDLIRYSSDNILLAKQECHKVLLNPLPNSRLRFKLCDFGRSGATENISKMDDGDGRYLPPLNDSHSSSHSMATFRDTFALALTVYECLGGKVTQELSRSFRDGLLRTWPENITDELRYIIENMTQDLSLREVIEMKQIRKLIVPEAWEMFQYGDLSSSMAETMTSDSN